MISARIEEMGTNAELFSDGLRAWFNGSAAPDAEAAGVVFSDAVLLIRQFLKK